MLKNLNTGGAIGAFIPLAIGIAVISIWIVPSHNQEAMNWAVKATIAALVTCAFAGNLLWGKFVSKPDDGPPPKRDRGIMP